MAIWEYKTLEFSTKGFWVGGILDTMSFNDELNKAGKDGWELVSLVNTNQHQGASRKIIAVFKKEKDAGYIQRIL